MTGTKVVFEDADSYEQFMGRWSRALGALFLDWLSPPTGARWLDVGCGTGVFTQLVLDACSPATVVAVDPAAAQIEYARGRPMAQGAEFRVADAQELPFPPQSFDVVVSALVLNLVPNRPRALAEMRRVCRCGGVVAAYVWDFADERSMAWPVVRAMRQIGVEPPRFPGSEDSSMEAIKSLLERGGYEDIATRSIDVTMGFLDFDDFWRSQVPPFSSHGRTIEALSDTVRKEVADAARAILPVGPDGGIAYSARANAAKARVPE